MRYKKRFCIWVICAISCGCQNRNAHTNVGQILYKLPVNWLKQSKHYNGINVVFFNQQTLKEKYTENIIITKINGQSLKDVSENYIQDIRRKNVLFNLLKRTDINTISYSGIIEDFKVRKRNVDIGCTVLFIKFNDGDIYMISHAGLNDLKGSYALQRNKFMDILDNNLN